MEVVNILPTPVLIVKCPFHDKIKQTILDEIEEQKVNQLSYNVNSKELKHVGHYSVLHDDSKYGRFRNWCEQQAEYYAKEVKGDYVQETVQVTDSWYNISDKGGYQHPHFHSNSYLSCIYYVNFDVTKDHVNTHFTREESLYFPVMPALGLMRKKFTEYNQDNQIVVSEGELMIFPSQIIHGYDDNKGDNRVTLSMNMMPTIVTNGDYGWRCVNLTPQERMKAFDTKENLNLTKDK